MSATPGALQLRLLQTVTDVAAEKNSTLVMPFPVELLRFFEKVTDGQTAAEAPAVPAAADVPAVPADDDPAARQSELPTGLNGVVPIPDVAPEVTRADPEDRP
jgi:hypothetical protein